MPARPAGVHYQRRLVAALAITLVVLVAEAVAAWLTGSLALLAYAGYMLADSAGLAIALIAAWLASRPTTDRWTFGFQRAEILAALVNGAVLALVGLAALVEGVRRLNHPGQVDGEVILLLGLLGLTANIVTMWLLSRGSQTNLNLRGAYLEVLGDRLAAVTVIVAALVVAWTGWHRADAAASITIGLLLLPRAIALLRDVTHVLLEGVPTEVDVATVRSCLEPVPGVVKVYDLHLWAITSGVPVLSAHVVIDDEDAIPVGLSRVLTRARTDLAALGIADATIQLEPESHERTQDGDH